MRSDLVQRPEWEIDRVLQRLVGEEVRVAAESFSPTPWHRPQPGGLVAVRNLILPDNSAVSVLPVYFEGRLERFAREIGVVHVVLGPPASMDKSAEGIVLFRRQSAVILRGPAVVKLAFPFRVEKLPADPGNYWRDVRLPRVQFEFGF